MLEVRGPNVFAGYWRLPEKTAEEMRADGFFVTGDMARIEADGYVTIVGRAKDLIITGGLNVYPKEIEQAIDALPGVIESAVVGVPHPGLRRGGGGGGDRRRPGDVVAALRGQLAGFKLPKHVAVVDELPRNAMGKVQKNVLRERFAGLFAGELVGAGEPWGRRLRSPILPRLVRLTGHSVSAILRIRDGPSRRSIRPSMRNWRRFRRTFARE